MKDSKRVIQGLANAMIGVNQCETVDQQIAVVGVLATLHVAEQLDRIADALEALTRGEQVKS